MCKRASNCTACIDACDEVMDKVGLRRGLIRYTSATAVQQGKTTWLTTRIKAYVGVWLVLVAIVVTLFALRGELDIQIVRQSGSLWTTTADGVANFYNIQVINKSDDMHDIQVSVASPAGATLRTLGPIREIGPNAIAKGRLLVIVPDSIRSTENSTVTLVVTSNGAEVTRTNVSFVAPTKGQ
ncbi:MAG: hypothetical protein FGM24_11280, partial [Candidatus Kapabacteria bacterium]|nr:hypothetical protein [Candidatus Kapabacteria bacterium]